MKFSFSSLQHPDGIGIISVHKYDDRYACKLANGNWGIVQINGTSSLWIAGNKVEDVMRNLGWGSAMDSEPVWSCAGRPSLGALPIENNDGRTTCYACGAATKRVQGFLAMSTYDVCTKCGK